MTTAQPPAWVDGDPLMEAVAAAVWEQCRTEGTSLVVDDPRNIAAVAAAAARQLPAEHCVHDAAIHHRHHQPRNPVIGCPWCEGGTRVDSVETGGLT